ncbi:MAG: YdcF family protein [Eubacterium sp.]|nr:YdcF family protein [Eubacterium sp.]
MAKKELRAGKTTNKEVKDKKNIDKKTIEDKKQDKKLNKKQDKKSKKNPFLKIIIGLVLICIITLAGVLGVNLYVKAKTNDRLISLDQVSQIEDVDCILVLGCGVNADGSLTYMLRDRLELSAQVYKTGVSSKLLMSGDHREDNYNEVQAMKNYILNKNVADSTDIFMDHAGLSTYESIYRAKEIFGAKKIIIVSNTYHVYRALYIAEKFGIEAYGLGTDDVYIGSEYREMREILARDKDFLKCIYKPEPTYLGETIDIHGDGNVTND